MILARLNKFARAQSGLAALEFAILLPMMVVALFGSIDVIDTLNANKRAQNVAASLSDVVARDTEISNAEVSGLWSACDILMYPNTSSAMKVRVDGSMDSVRGTAARMTLARRPVVWMGRARQMALAICRDLLSSPNL